MFDCAIPIGGACNITFLLQNAKIKKQTTLFEWFVSPNLRDITSVLIKIGDNTDNNIVTTNNTHIFIGDKIFSVHYSYANFKTIYERRRTRLLNDIKSSKKILFCRFEGFEGGDTIVYNKEDIDDFINSILTINTNLEDIKILLISPNKTGLDHPSLINVMYDKHASDPYCKSQEINELFVNTLRKIGYNLNDTTDMCFTDMS